MVDLPGSGRSSGPPTTPRRAGTSLAEAIASFAPQAKLIAGVGDGALAAVATASRRPSVAAVVLVDALPGASPGDDELLWGQIEASPGAVELVRSADGPVSEEDLARLYDRKPDAVITCIAAGDDLETSAAAILADTFVAALERAAN